MPKLYMEHCRAGVVIMQVLGTVKNTLVVSIGIVFLHETVTLLQVRSTHFFAHLYGLAVEKTATEFAPYCECVKSYMLLFLLHSGLWLCAVDCSLLLVQPHQDAANIGQ